ncbi:MAG TPA: hypothetical protein VEV15_04725 [Flavisolibacter sp.]|nr:hypothetical protein [Flavisolibacter sp.]
MEGNLKYGDITGAIIDYLEAHDLEIGLLINFGAKSLQFKRLINQHKLHQQKHPVNPVNQRS